MARRIGRLFLLSCGLGFALLALTVSPEAFAQKEKPKEPLWTHAFDLSCRKFGESEFTDKTQKFGVEVFKDTNTGSGLYVSQVGSFAAAGGFDGIKSAIKGSKGPEWISGLDLPSRKAGEKEFTKDTRVYAMEVFYDGNVGNWVYITNNGSDKEPKGNVSVTPAPKGVKPAPGNLKAPKWLHSVDLSCRKGGVREWQNAQKFGIEVYRDNNTGNLIYICDTGAIAVLPEKGESKAADGKAPVWLHGLDLYCRKHNEMDFTKTTKKFGVEVFRDQNNGNLIYLSETGDLAVLPAPKAVTAPTANVKEPKWTHGLNLSSRKAGEKEFTPKTQVYGAEVFNDDNTGVTLYIAETGSITAIPTK